MSLDDFYDIIPKENNFTILFQTLICDINPRNIFMRFFGYLDYDTGMGTRCGYFNTKISRTKMECVCV